MRFVGLRQHFSAPPHPWFQEATWTFYAPPLETVCASHKIVVPAPVKVRVPIRYHDGEWRVPCPQDAFPVAELIQASPVTDWLLEIEATEPAHLDNLVETVGPFDRDRRFAVFAPAQQVAKDLRKRAPQWLFAADGTSLLRLRLFAGLRIETAVEFWPDFVITSNSEESPARLDAALAEELIRREKRLIWDARAGAPKPAFPVQGVLTDQPPAD